MSFPDFVYLDDLICGAAITRTTSGSDANKLKITGIAYDSRQVKPGFLFAAIPGFKVDGHDFVPRALEAGAAAVLTERWLDLAGVIQVQVESVRKIMPLLASNFYDHPSKNLTVIGVTGTNGKSTTAFLIDAILKSAGLRTGLIGGIEYRIGDSSIPAKRTTPEALDIQRMMFEMNDQHIGAVTMEVSSHGIDLYRVACTEFDVAVFTNLTRDHLDLHGNLEDYFESKRKLFTGALLDPAKNENAISPNRPIAAINVDNEYGQRLADELSDRLYTFGMKPQAQVRARDIEYNGWETRFELVTPSGATPVQLQLPGAFNLENALSASAAALALGIPLESIAAGLSESRGAPGRFEPVNINAPFRVVVDYAHNEDGLLKALTTARALTDGRLITVFGCPGERDREKRPGMGKIAGSLSDLAILTTDDCYEEPSEQILDQTEAGLNDSGAEYLRIEDRRQAIETAIEAAREGDTVLIAGKGHERSQIMAEGPRPFNDSDTVKEIVKNFFCK